MAYLNSLTVNSKDRSFGTRTKFNLLLNSVIEFKKVELESSNIPNSFYNYVNVSINIGGNVIVLNGCYSATSLATYLQSSLPGTYTVNFSFDLVRFIITNTAPFTLTFPSLNDARIMGFDNLVTNSDINDTIISDRPPDMQKYKNVFININQIGAFQLGSSQNTSLFTFKVPIFANRTESLPYRMLSYFEQTNPLPDTKLSIKNIEVNLYGDDGLLIDESQINDWMFSIRFW